MKITWAWKGGWPHGLLRFLFILSVSYRSCQRLSWLHGIQEVWDGRLDFRN